MRRRLARILGLLSLGAVAFLVGCESSQVRASAESRQRWNDARAEVKLKLAADQLNAGHIADAANEINAAAQLDPTHPALRTLQARLCLAQGDLSTAEQLLRNAPPESTNRGEIAYLLGVIAEQRMRWQEAMERYVEAVQYNPEEIAYVTAIVQLMLQQGKASDALAWLRSQEIQFGWTGAYQAALAECYEQLQDWPHAVSAWRRVADADANADIRERLALALCRAGQWGEAVAQLRSLLDARGDKSQNMIRTSLAECYLHISDPRSAHEQLTYVLRDNPRDPCALRLLACAYARENLFTQAHQAAEQALLAAPGDVNTLEITATMAYRAGRLDRAAELARQITRRNPGSENSLAAGLLEAIDPSAAK